MQKKLDEKFTCSAVSRKLVLIGLSFLVFGISSCATRRQNMQVKQGVHDVKTRLLALEQKMHASAAGSEPVDKRVAAISADFETVQQELRFLKGKIDSLEVGIGLGYMPGTSPQEGSVAVRLEGMEKRIAEIETTQKEILQLITKGNRKKTLKRTKSVMKTPKDLTEMERYFSKKKYKEVSKSGERLAEKEKGANKRRMLFLTAESFFQMKKYGKSAFYFHSFVDLDPQKNVAHTKLRLAQAYSKLGDSETAEIYFEEVKREFPSSPEAELAEKELSQLRVVAKK